MIFADFSQKVADKLHFKPNSSQEKVLHGIDDFLFGGDTADAVYLLRGYAGTGKTSLLGAVVRALDEMKVPILLMAPTGRAAKVLAHLSGHPAFTIHRCIYQQKRYSPFLEGFDLRKNLHPHTIFICDEASMISTSSSVDEMQFGSGNVLNDLLEFVYYAGGHRLLLVGDNAQLPPVGQPFSPALEESVLQAYRLKVYSASLTEVARQQADSGILYNATRLRLTLMGDPAGLTVLPRLACTKFPDVQPVYGMDLVEQIARSYSKMGVDETIIITRSNARAVRLNLGIRQMILDYEEEITAGDRLLVAKNNYYWGRDLKELPFIANGDVMVVNRVRQVVSYYGFRFAHLAVTFPDYEVDTEVVVMLDTLQSQSAALSQPDQQRLFNEVAKDYPECHNKSDLYKAIRENPYYNALQVKYAYSVTCHKSQGGQWQDVYVDLGYIKTEYLGIDFYRWLYTAVTRAKQHLYLIDVSDEMKE